MTWEHVTAYVCNACMACRLQVWLQEFAWTEGDKPVKLEARSVMVPNNDKLKHEPIFCFETMMNLLYWSCFVYDHKKVRLTIVTL